MKRAFQTLAIAAMIGITVTADAQTSQTLISFRDGSVSQVVATPKYAFHVGKAGIEVDTWGFGGYSFSNGKLTGGLAASHRFDFAKEAFADIGVYVRAADGRKLDGGLFVGIGFRL